MLLAAESLSSFPLALPRTSLYLEPNRYDASVTGSLN